jgi:molecular chaperone HtpG
MVQTMREFDGKTLRSVSQGSFENSDSKEEKIIDAKTNDILNAIKEVLGETKVVEVTESERLTESAVCLVSREGSMTFNMAKVLAESGQDMFGMGAERILEINIKHPIFEKIKNEFDSNKSSDLFKEYSELLYDEACILEGIKLDDPMLFAKRMNSLLMK